MTYKTGFIIMTALLPTKGHEDLINFGLSFLNARGPLTVMVCSRSFEPISGGLRVRWFREIFRDEIGRGNLRIVHLKNDQAPQNPEDLPEFWEWWGNKIYEACYADFPDYVLGSEKYGIRLAEEVNAQFIPYDVSRTLRPISSTEVRKNLLGKWDHVVEPARRHLNKTHGRFVLFGQESVGKTTIAKSLADSFSRGFTFSPEWARPYLETVGAELTEEKMKNIFDGQFAQEDVLLGRNPISFLDTDVLSTIGYMRLKGWEVPEAWVFDYKNELKANKYFVLPPDVPFEKDPLRYGGDVRETTTEYWINLLEEFEADYVVVPDGTLESKTNFVFNSAMRTWSESTKAIREFERD